MVAPVARGRGIELGLGLGGGAAACMHGSRGEEHTGNKQEDADRENREKADHEHHKRAESEDLEPQPWPRREGRGQAEKPDGGEDHNPERGLRERTFPLGGKDGDVEDVHCQGEHAPAGSGSRNEAHQRSIATGRSCRPAEMTPVLSHMRGASPANDAARHVLPANMAPFRHLALPRRS
jgi:hypothetical protein